MFILWLVAVWHLNLFHKLNIYCIHMSWFQKLLQIGAKGDLSAYKTEIFAHNFHNHIYLLSLFKFSSIFYQNFVQSYKKCSPNFICLACFSLRKHDTKAKQIHGYTMLTTACIKNMANTDLYKSIHRNCHLRHALLLMNKEVDHQVENKFYHKSILS